ncbi:MAG: hypothetical protein ACI4XB_02175 [Ruminococcus sp.]
MKTARKKKIIVWIILLSVLLLILAACSWHLYRKYAIGSVGKNIMREIDSHADANGDCTLDLREMTDFEWDTLVVFDADFSVYYGGYKSDHDVASEKMSQILGMAYERPSGYRALLIFMKNGEIVHEESYLADIEAPSKMNISVPPEYFCQGFDACCIFSADEANIAASCDNEHYYLYF